MSEMQGKAAVVTGASSGIGRATAIRFAREGAHVALVARRWDELKRLAEQIEQDGGSAIPICTDVTKTTEVESCIETVVNTLGGIDVLVNAAGIIARGGIQEATLQEWDRMIEVNVRSMFYMIKRALPYLIERKGAIVNVSSVASFRAYSGMVSYCVSKAAVDQLTRCVALDLAGKGVRVNAVNPGTVATDLHYASGMKAEDYAAFIEHSKRTHPLGRVGKAEEIAELIYFLASPRAAWITGVTYPIDGGRSLTVLL